MSVLAHPHPIRIIEQLRTGERDVTSLQGALGVSHLAVSQHVVTVRAHGIVAERLLGGRVFNNLCQPGLPSWLMAATHFLENGSAAVGALYKAIQKPCRVWATPRYS